MKPATTHVYRKVLPNGVEILLDRKNYQIVYPAHIWKDFPDIYRQNFADSLAYSLTMHLCLNGHERILYEFPQPQIEPYIFEGMVYSLGETTLLEGKETRTSDLLRLFYNRNLNVQFSGRPRLSRFKYVNRNSRNRAIIPFSFGKDSLLTFALCLEMGVEPYPVFFREPKSPFENRHKRKLADRFFDEFDMDINFFPVTAGRLRQTTGKWWGWDLLLTQYTLMLIPYTFSLRSRYLFWAHEQSCNEYLTDTEGYNINPVFEQSSRWLLTSNNLTRNFGTNVVLSSLIEPLHEIAIMKILHHRYPAIAKYQLSCFGEEDEAASKRWCGQCSKCGRIYIFMLALGINPKAVGFTEPLLGHKKRELYSLFVSVSPDGGVYDKSGLGRDEQLLAFYLAYQQGVRGELMKEFASKFLLEARAREKELREKFFSVYDSESQPYELRSQLQKIFKQELSDLT